MTCSKCGNRNGVDLKFCGKCGTPVPQDELDRLTVGNNVSGEYNFKNIVKFDVAEEDGETIAIKGFALDAGLFYKGLSALLLLSFFLPFYRVSAPGFVRGAYTISGFHIAFGWEASSGTAMGFVLFFIPFLVFALFQFRRDIQKAGSLFRSWFFAIALGLVAVGMIALFVSAFRISHPLISVWPSIGFVFSFILYLLAGAVSLGLVIAGSKR